MKGARAGSWSIEDKTESGGQEGERERKEGGKGGGKGEPWVVETVDLMNSRRAQLMSKTCELRTLESRQERLGLSARCSQSTVFQGGGRWTSRTCGRTMGRKSARVYLKAGSIRQAAAAAAAAPGRAEVRTRANQPAVGGNPFRNRQHAQWSRGCGVQRNNAIRGGR